MFSARKKMSLGPLDTLVYIFHPLRETALIALPREGNGRASRRGSYILRHTRTQNSAAALRTGANHNHA